MIWYFIAGFAAGVIGTLMMGRHFARRMEIAKDDERSAESP